MRIRVYSKGKFNLIECPDGARVVRCSARSVPDGADSHDHLIVPFGGQEIAIPIDPPELVPLLADSGRCGLSLLGGPEPDTLLVGVSCPRCNEDDVN